MKLLPKKMAVWCGWLERESNCILQTLHCQISRIEILQLPPRGVRANGILKLSMCNTKEDNFADKKYLSCYCWLLRNRPRNPPNGGCETRI